MKIENHLQLLIIKMDVYCLIFSLYTGFILKPAKKKKLFEPIVNKLTKQINCSFMIYKYQ